MAAKWLIGLSMLFVLATIASGIIEQTYLGTSEAGALWTLISSFEAMSITSFSSVLVAAGALSAVLIQMFSFDYAFLTGIWFIFRILGICISVGVGISFLLTIASILPVPFPLSK